MTTIWLPIIISGLIALWAMWPRFDGGGIQYNLMLISAEGPGGIDLQWYLLGAMALPWIIWGILVVAFA